MRKLYLLLLMLSLCVVMPAQKTKGKATTQQKAVSQKKTQQQKKTQAQQSKSKQQKSQKTKLTERQKLENQKKLVQQQQAEARKRQKELEGKVATGLKNVQILDGEIENKRIIIDSIQHDIVVMDSVIDVLNAELRQLERELKERKDLYMKSVRDMYRNRKTQNKMMFVFSAKNFNQMYRRLHYMNEYATFQKAQGEAVKQKSEQVEQKRQELSGRKDQKTTLLTRSQDEQRQMERKQTDQKVLVAELQKEQNTVKKLIAKQQQEERDLDAKIEKAIRDEIARAEAEARRKAEEERKRAEAEARKSGQGSGKQTAGNGKSNGKRTGSDKSKTKTEHFELPAADRALTGSFESNKGKLPIPITGSYSLIRGLGLYSVAGMKGVTLESKGLYYKGQSGAQARCVFDGQVSAIVQRGNSYVVMVRHGQYISVYCNLASVSVSVRQNVKTNQILGAVGEDHVLQFQLRNWTQILNPKPWLSR